MGRPFITDIRICAACDSTKTYISNRGYFKWYFHDGHVLCNDCHDKYVYGPIRDAKWHPINNPRRIRFKNKHIFLNKNPRKGKCSKCGKIGLTDMHHRKYDDANPIRYTRELCDSCHGKIKKIAHV